MWYCSYCSRDVKLSNRLKKLKSKQEAMETRQCFLEDDINTVKEGTEKQMSEFDARHDSLKEEMVVMEEEGLIRKIILLYMGHWRR